MKCKRKDLLEQLKMVVAGLSKTAIIEQSSCFAFTKGKVMTFNDDITCSYPIKLKIKGAVESKPLLALLGKMTEEEIEINVVKEKGGQVLNIKGKRKKADIKMEADVRLPVDSVDNPKKWEPIPKHFIKAVKSVKDCAGIDESKFMLTCIHIAEKYIEACDGVQVARYKIKTVLKKPILIKKDVLQQITGLDIRKYSVTKNWIHFKNKKGLVVSCRKYNEKYQTDEITKLLKAKGNVVVFPKQLAKATDRSEVFSADGSGSSKVHIFMKDNKLKITGDGDYGIYEEKAKVKYTGRPISFYISPQTLREVLSGGDSDCRINNNILKIEKGNFTYATCLGVVE